MSLVNSVRNNIQVVGVCVLRMPVMCVVYMCVDLCVKYEYLCVCIHWLSSQWSTESFLFLPSLF